MSFGEFIAWIQLNPQAAAILLPAIFTGVGGLISQLFSWRDKEIKKIELEHKEKELEQQEKLRELEIKEAEENLRHILKKNRQEEEISEATLENLKVDTALKKINVKIKEKEHRNNRIS